MRILWFANTPGLSQSAPQGLTGGGGWISSFQAELEKSGQGELGLVYYADRHLDSFSFGRTTYFPVRRLNHSRNKRVLQRMVGKVEYDENLDEFLAIIRQFQPDVIHILGTENSFGLIQSKVGKIPVIVSIQGNLTVYAHKYFSGIRAPGLLKQFLRGNPFLLADYRLVRKRSEIEREILSGTAYVCGRTEWDRQVSRVLAPHAQYFHLDEIMRPAFYNQQWHARQQRQATVFTTSSASMYKGLETLIQTARLLAKSQFNFRWLVAGLKEEDSFVRLVKRILEVRRLNDLHIELLGSLDAESLASRLLESDIFVQVSHAENSPNSLCEAMLLGLPVMASFAGGTSTLVKPGETGTLLPDGDPYALAGALIQHFHLPQTGCAMAANGRREAHARHDRKKILESALSMYREVANRHALT
jgi:glycosyltransferase involved in cell wall biosynthesis